MYLLQFDGMLQTPDGYSAPTGLLGYGWLLTAETIEIAHGFGLFLCRGAANSSQAEYLALIEGLEAMADLRISREHIEVRGDARAIIDQMQGLAAISSLSTRRFHQRAQKLARQFDHLTWKWIPRSENKLADRLSRRSLRQLYAMPQAYEKILSHTQGKNGLVSLMDLRLYNPLS